MDRQELLPILPHVEETFLLCRDLMPNMESFGEGSFGRGDTKKPTVTGMFGQPVSLQWTKRTGSQ